MEKIYWSVLQPLVLWTVTYCSYNPTLTVLQWEDIAYFTAGHWPWYMYLKQWSGNMTNRGGRRNFFRAFALVSAKPKKSAGAERKKRRRVRQKKCARSCCFLPLPYNTEIPVSEPKPLGSLVLIVLHWSPVLTVLSWHPILAVLVVQSSVVRSCAVRSCVVRSLVVWNSVVRSSVVRSLVVRSSVVRSSVVRSSVVRSLVVRSSVVQSSVVPSSVVPCWVIRSSACRSLVGTSDQLISSVN